MSSPAQSSPDHPDLVDLIARLRRAGFRPDTRQYITAHQVLLSLAMHGAAAADLAAAAATDKQGETARAVLTSHLGPVFCTAPEQQVPFAEIVRQWLRADRVAPVDDETHRIEEQRRRLLERQHLLRLIRWVALVAVAVGGAGLAAWRYEFAVYDLAIRVVGLNPPAAGARPNALTRQGSADTVPLPGAAVTFHDATVSLDGAAGATLPLRRFDGELPVAVSHPGYDARQLTVTAGQASPLVIELQPRPRPSDTETDSPLRLGSPATLSLPDITPDPVVERDWRLALVLGAVTGAAMFLVLDWLDRRRRRSVLRRMPAEGRSDLESLRFEPAPLAPLGSRELRRLVGGLRRQRELEASGLDVERTVTATARAAGLFTPVFSAQRRMPEYVVLSERRSADDHCYQWVESLLDPLARNGVPLERYEFSADPSVCRRTDNPARQFTLAELAVVHHSAVLLVFAETDTFFDPLTGELSLWVERLRAWHRRAVFTFQPPYLWGERERLLAGTGAIVLPATTDGLRAFGDAASDAGSRGKERPAYARRYPGVLTGSSMRWLEREAPAASTIEMVVAQLRSYLGPSGFDWLAACAVYPQISWPLTLDLASSVAPGRSTAQEFTSSVLPALARLPWLRHAFMPDWLRRTLVRQLAPEAEGRIRSHLDAVLNRLGRRHRAPGLAEEHTLDITAADMVATAPPDSPMKDAVFIGFVSGTNTPDLAVLAPRPLVQLFRRLRQLQTPEEQKVTAPARSWAQRTAALVRLFHLAHLRLVRLLGSLVAALAVAGVAAIVTTRTTVLSGPLDGFHTLAFSREGVLAAGIAGEAIKLWNQSTRASRVAGLRDGPDIGRQEYSALALSPDAQEIAFATRDGRFGTVRVDGTHPLSASDPRGPVVAVAIASGLLATVSQQGESSEIRFWKASGPNFDQSRQGASFADSRAQALALDASGELAALAGEGVINFVGASGEPVTTISGIGTPNALAISPDRLWVAAGVGQQLSLRQISTGRVLAQVNTGGSIRAIAVSDSGKQVGVLSDVSIAVWPVVAQLPNASEQSTLVTPTQSVRPTRTRGKAGPIPNAPNYQQAPPQGAINAPPNAADANVGAPERIPNLQVDQAAPPPQDSVNAPAEPNVRTQPEPTIRRSCGEVIDIRKLGWRDGNQTEFCRNQKFDGYIPAPRSGAGFCYRGDLDTCREQAGVGAPSRY